MIFYLTKDRDIKTKEDVRMWDTDEKVILVFYIKFFETFFTVVCQFPTSLFSDSLGISSDEVYCLLTSIEFNSKFFDSMFLLLLEQNKGRSNDR